MKKLLFLAVLLFAFSSRCWGAPSELPPLDLSYTDIDIPRVYAQLVVGIYHVGVLDYAGYPDASIGLPPTGYGRVYFSTTDGLLHCGTSASANCLATGGVPSGAAGGDLSGTYPNPSVAKLHGTTVTGTPSVGQVPTATSSSAATWQTVGGILDVTAFGADSTGVADSLAGVEAAMTAACARTPKGAIVLFPPGKFTFSDIIPSTGSLWCSGLTIKGSGVRATELDFPTGSGFALTEAGGSGLGNNIRNLTIEDFLLVVGGGSGGSNNGLGGIFIGNYAFTHEYRNLYIIGPTTSTAHGISTTGDTYVSTIGLDNVRIDNFQGVNGTAFFFEVSGTGDLLRCTFCYAASPYIGIDVGFFWTAVLESSDVDGSTGIGFYLHPGTGNTIIGNGLSGEGNTHDLYRIYGNAGATQGGTVILNNPKSTGQLSATSALFPIDITNYSGDVTIVDPVTTATGGSAIASLNINNTPHAVTVIGCDQYLDKGLSSSANTYLSQGQGNVCSNSQGSLTSQALAQPPTPTATPTCTGTCASTWGYEIVAFDANPACTTAAGSSLAGCPTQASAQGSTAANASTLDSSHYNTVTWVPVAGARSYNVYRTASGGTPANLSLVCTGETIGNVLSCKDDGSVNTASKTPSATNFTGYLSSSGLLKGTLNTVELSANFTCGSGGTITDCNTSPVAITGLSIPLPPIAQLWHFDCTGTVGQATGAVANSWDVQVSGTAPTALQANYIMATAATASAYGYLAAASNTTLDFISPSWTLGGTGTTMPFHIFGTIEGASTSGSTFNLGLKNGNNTNVITIFRGSACHIY